MFLSDHAYGYNEKRIDGLKNHYMVSNCTYSNLEKFSLIQQEKVVVFKKHAFQRRRRLI